MPPWLCRKTCDPGVGHAWPVLWDSLRASCRVGGQVQRWVELRVAQGPQSGAGVKGMLRIESGAVFRAWLELV